MAIFTGIVSAASPSYGEGDSASCLLQGCCNKLSGASCTSTCQPSPFLIYNDLIRNVGKGCPVLIQLLSESDTWNGSVFKENVYRPS